MEVNFPSVCTCWLRGHDKPGNSHREQQWSLRPFPHLGHRHHLADHEAKQQDETAYSSEENRIISAARAPWSERSYRDISIANPTATFDVILAHNAVAVLDALAALETADIANT